jgi:hypothetical protein
MLHGLLLLGTAAGFVLLGGCSGGGDANRTCEIVAPPTQVTDRISLAQCGDGTVCIGACGGTQDSNNPTSDDDTTRTTINNFPTPTPSDEG